MLHHSSSSWTKKKFKVHHHSLSSLLDTSLQNIMIRSLPGRSLTPKNLTDLATTSASMTSPPVTNPQKPHRFGNHLTVDDVLGQSDKSQFYQAFNTTVSPGLIGSVHSKQVSLMQSTEPQFQRVWWGFGPAPFPWMTGVSYMHPDRNFVSKVSVVYMHVDRNFVSKVRRERL